MLRAGLLPDPPSRRGIVPCRCSLVRLHQDGCALAQGARMAEGQHPRALPPGSGREQRAAAIDPELLSRVALLLIVALGLLPSDAEPGVRGPSGRRERRPRCRPGHPSDRPSESRLWCALHPVAALPLPARGLDLGLRRYGCDRAFLQRLRRRRNHRRHVPFLSPLGGGSPGGASDRAVAGRRPVADHGFAQHQILSADAVLRPAGLHPGRKIVGRRSGSSPPLRPRPSARRCSSSSSPASASPDTSTTAHSGCPRTGGSSYAVPPSWPSRLSARRSSRSCA